MREVSFLMMCRSKERFSYDLEMKTREQNRNNKRTEIEQYDWSVERIQTLVAFDWFSERSGEKTCHARELSRNQSTLCFDVMLQHHWPIEGCPLHIRVFFGGKTKSPYFDLFIHWLIKQIMNTHRNHFSRSYENRSNSEVINIASIYSYFNTFFERNEITLPVSLTIWLIKNDGRVSGFLCESLECKFNH